MVTLVPGGPDVGEKAVTVGAEPPLVTVNTPGLSFTPPGVATVMGPVSAPVGTVAVMRLEVVAEKETAATPPKATERAPVKFAPLIDTTVPGGPDTGEKSLTTGAAAWLLDPEAV